MKIRRSVSLLMAFALISCEKTEETEVEIIIDEQKLGRAIGKHFVIESQKLITDTMVLSEKDTNMTLPSSPDQQNARAGSPALKVTLEITNEGKLYGASGQERILLAEKVSESTLAEAEEWLMGFQDDFQNLTVTIVIDENQPHQSAISLIDLLRGLKISKVRFSDLAHSNED